MIANLTEVECESLLTYLEKSKAVKKIVTLEDRKEKFKAKLKENHDNNLLTLQEFFEYWTEHNDNGKKMRFEMAKNQPFNIKRRLSTWKKNSDKWQDKTKPISLADKMKQQYGL